MPVALLSVAAVEPAAVVNVAVTAPHRARFIGPRKANGCVGPTAVIVPECTALAWSPAGGIPDAATPRGAGLPISDRLPSRLLDGAKHRYVLELALLSVLLEDHGLEIVGILALLIGRLHRTFADAGLREFRSATPRHVVHGAVAHSSPPAVTPNSSCVGSWLTT